LIGLLALPTFYYELIVRSELFFNMSVFILLIILSERYLDATRVDFSFLILALLFGLCLSTRLITILVFVAYLTQKFHENILNGLLFAGTSMLMFLLTLLPFLLWNSTAFVLHGPFSIQMSYLPPVIAFLFVLSAIFIGWKSPTLRVLFLSLGVLLFGIVLASFLLTSETSNYASVVIDDGFDISYVIFSVPFLLLALEKVALAGARPRWRALLHKHLDQSQERSSS